MRDFALHKRKTSSYLPRKELDSGYNGKISAYLINDNLNSHYAKHKETRQNAMASFTFLLKKGELLFLIEVIFVYIPGIELGLKVKEWHQTHMEVE